MKRIFAALMLALMLVTLTFTSCGNNDGAPEGMKLASGEGAAHTLYVPDNWIVDYSTDITSAYYSVNDPSSVSVMSWDVKYTDTTLDDWWEVNIEQINVVFKDVKIIADKTTTVDDLYAKKYEYTGFLGDTEYKIMQVAIFKEASGFAIKYPPIVYVFTYTSVVDNYDLHLDEVTLMLDYMQID